MPPNETSAEFIQLLTSNQSRLFAYTLSMLGEWQHVAFVADGAQLRLYRNGMQVGSVPYPGLAPPDLKPLGIGAKPAGVDQKRVRGPSGFWHGRIDELAIFNHAVDAKMIQQLFETNRSRPGQRAVRRRR